MPLRSNMNPTPDTPNLKPQTLIPTGRIARGKECAPCPTVIDHPSPVVLDVHLNRPLQGPLPGVVKCDRYMTVICEHLARRSRPTPPRCWSGPRARARRRWLLPSTAAMTRRSALICNDVCPQRCNMMYVLNMHQPSTYMPPTAAMTLRPAGPVGCM